MRGSAILRELRSLSHLPLRRETIYHLALSPDGLEPPILNRLIAADPAFALAALRSAPRGFRDGRPGIPQIARFITRQGVVDLLQSARATDMENGHSSTVDRLWTHSIAIAYAARQLSRDRRCNHPQSAFLAGLLHNLGLLAIGAVAPEAVHEHLAAADPAGDHLLQEKSRFGNAHTTVGSQLAKRWGLPTWLAEVIRWHHQSPSSMPADLTDPVLIELIREADEMISRSEFSLLSTADETTYERRVKRGDPMRFCVVSGVRQAAAFLGSHALRAGGQNSENWLEQVVDVATRNASLHAELGWQSDAWEGYRRLPPDAAPADLTVLVAETFREALGALGVLCYIRNTDGSVAEGSFCCDGSRTIACAIKPGGATSHSEQVVAHLRATWQQRPYRVVDLEWSEEILAHVLVWIDEFGPAPSDETLGAVRSVCASWLAKAAHVAELESQVQSFEEALRNQALQGESRLEHAKLAALAEMAAGAGHEFNNPLAVISGRAQLLLTEETDPRRRKSLETIMSQAQRVHRMIVELMFFARPPVPDRKPSSVTEVVDRAMAAVQRDAEHRKVSLNATVQPDLPLIDGDTGQLAAAIECILQNSLEATPEDGSVHLTVEVAERGTIQFRICDTGRGITEEQRQHIFEPFYCGREAGRGLGMGLPKAWSIVQNHNGEIAIHSAALGTGTTVTVRLPALAADSQQRACA